MSLTAIHVECCRMFAETAGYAKDTTMSVAISALEELSNHRSKDQTYIVPFSVQPVSSIAVFTDSLSERIGARKM